MVGDGNTDATKKTPPRETGRTVLSRLIRALIIIAILALSVWYVTANIDWDGLGRAILQMHVGWVIAGALATLIAHLARAHRWRVLIPGGASIGIAGAFSATIIGYLMNNLIPRSGELVRPYVLAKRENRPVSSLMATILVERVLDGLTLVAIFVMLLFLERERLDSIFTGYSAGSILLSIAVPILAIVIALVVLLRTPLGERFAGVLDRVLPARFTGRITQILENFRRGITFGGARGTLRILFWTVVIWGGYCSAMYAGMLAFGFDTLFAMGPSDAVTMLAITAVGVTIAPTPGAFGVYHGFCKAGLTTLYGVPAESAVAFAVVTHAAPYLAVTIVGLIFFLKEGVSFRGIRSERVSS